MLSEDLKYKEGEFSEQELLDFIEKLADKIVSMKLSALAIVTLESIKPLSFLTSQAMVFFEPFVNALFDTKGYAKLYKILENRELLEKLIVRIEEKS